MITGGGSEIGAATGELVCAEGGTAILVDANPDALASTANAIAGQVPGARVMTLVADVADGGEAERAVARALDEFGQLDVLVNNAYDAQLFRNRGRKPGGRHSPGGGQLVGAANYCRSALPALRKRTRASIVNVSSCYAVAGLKGRAFTMPPRPACCQTRTLAFEESAHRVASTRSVRLDPDQLSYLESQGCWKKRRGAKDRTPDHVSARPLGNAAGNCVAHHLAGE